MANRYVKSCSASLIIREVHTKTAMRYPVLTVRRAVIKKTGNSKYWQRCGGKGALMCCWWAGKLVRLLWKTSWTFLKKIKSTTWCPWCTKHYINKTLTRKDACPPVLFVALFTIAKYRSNLRVHRQMNGFLKRAMRGGTLFGPKKGEPAVCDNMDGP